VQDHGAPIGWRLATHAPEKVTGIITRNGDGYTDGFVDDVWRTLLGLHQRSWTGDAARDARGADPESTRWQYLHGMPDESLVSPDAWNHDIALPARPGQDEIQLRLFQDYPANVELYPALQRYFRDSQVPLLAVWGEHGGIFGPDGARAFQRDPPKAEVHLIGSGHFAPESHLDEITGHIRRFLDGIGR
jgi:pimeloyl-ACP methyl ester carboxylesterase